MTFLYYTQDNSANHTPQNTLMADVGTSCNFIPIDDLGLSQTDSLRSREYAYLGGTLPPGISIQNNAIAPSTGQPGTEPCGFLTGVPTQAGTYTFVVTETIRSVVAGWSTITSSTITFIVKDVAKFYYTQDNTSTHTPQNTLTATVGTSCSFIPTETFPVGIAVTSRHYTFTGYLPDGVSLTNSNDASHHGSLTGTPTVAGTFAFTVRDTIQDGTFIEATVSLTVSSNNNNNNGGNGGRGSGGDSGGGGSGTDGGGTDGGGGTSVTPSGNMASPSKISRVGDMCSHNAILMTGDSSHLTNDQKTVRVGDLVNCPSHGVNPIIAQTTMTTLTGDQKNSRVSSLAQCGAIVVTGSDNVYSEDK